MRALVPQTALPAAAPLLSAAEVAKSELGIVGGKALALGTLVAEGLNVPPFFAVTTTVFDTVFAEIELEIARLTHALDYRDRAAVARAAADIKTAFVCAGLAPATLSAIEDAAIEHFAPGALVSVRSSAVGEDSAKDSFAGQLDTFLFVPRGEIAERVLHCFASAFSERALLYRHLRGLPAAGVRTAVVVQEMVDARVSGVLFTANPTTGDRNDVVVSAGLGLGEGIVSGTVECDTFYVNAATLDVRERVIGAKRTRIVFDKAKKRGTVVGEIPAEEGDAPALDTAQTVQLAEIGLGVARRRGTPQDLEWAIAANGELFVLQARPITTLAAGRQTIFDNSNVVESYPGVSLPLTYSFVRLGYEVLFRESARLFGVKDAVLEKNHDLFPSLLGLLGGRIYYNISGWYRMFLLLPGMEKAIPAWEKALGIERRFAQAKPKASFWAFLLSIPTRLALVFRLIKLWATLPRRVNEFADRCRALDAEAKATNHDELDTHQLLDEAERIARDLRPRYSVTVVNDFITQQLYEVLGRLIGRWQLGDAVTTRNELLCGERGMESVEPVRSIVRLAELVGRDPALTAIFARRAPADVIWKELQAHPAFAAAAALHIEKYGDRTLEELKLETPGLRERPADLVPMLKNYLRGGQNVEEMERHEQAIRKSAETRVAEGLEGHPLRRLVFGFVLSTLRYGIKTRENLRLARSRGFGIIKRFYRAVGRRLAAASLLREAGDVFYLSIDEVGGVVRGGQLTTDSRALVALRQREYEGFRQQQLAGRVVTHGPVAGNRYERALSSYDGEQTMRGIGCSPGRKIAVAKVVLEPKSDLSLDGQILVASATDPGWVFLMIAAGGLISEKGSVLSHTAIIGRELGIPTVVGVKDATTRIKDGAVVEIDGHAGTVTIQPAGHA